MRGAEWAQEVTRLHKKRRPARSVVSQVGALGKPAAGSLRNSATRIIVDTPVPHASHSLWLALPDSDEFIVRAWAVHTGVTAMDVIQSLSALPRRSPSLACA